MKQSQIIDNEDDDFHDDADYEDDVYYNDSEDKISFGGDRAVGKYNRALKNGVLNIIYSNDKISFSKACQQWNCH